MAFDDGAGPLPVSTGTAGELVSTDMCSPAVPSSPAGTCFSLSAWEAIVKPAVAPSLQCARISKTVPCTPLFAPPLCRGFGWKHPFHLQGLAHISTHIQESVTGGQTGSLLQQSCEALVMEAGVPIKLGDSAFDRHLTHLSPLVAAVNMAMRLCSWHQHLVSNSRSSASLRQ